MRVKPLLDEHMDESVRDRMLRFLGQQCRELLIKLACCADALTKIADRDVRTNWLLRGRPSRSAERSKRSYTRAGTHIDDDGYKKSSNILPRTWDRPHDNRYEMSSSPSSEKVLPCLVCSEKTHLILMCPNLPNSPKLLQKRNKNFTSFIGTVRSYQSRLTSGRRDLRGRNEGMRWGYDCGRSDCQRDKRRIAFIQLSLEQETI